MSNLRYIYELNGYLKSLATINGAKARFGVAAFEMDAPNNLYDSSIAWLEKNNCSGMTLSFSGKKDVFSLLNQRIFNGNRELQFLENASLQKMVLEDINEYIGLFSTSQNKNGVFHPILRSKTMIASDTVENGRYHNLIFIPVESYLVVISLKSK